MRSGLQTQVISLARSLLRAARKQPAASGVEDEVKASLRRDFAVSRTNTRLVEHLLRGGERQLQLLNSGVVTRVAKRSPPSSPPPTA